MSYNSQMGNNEYTTVEQRKKQNLSRLPVTQEPVKQQPAKQQTVTQQPVAASSGDNGYSEYKALLDQIKAEKQAQVNAAYNQGKQSLDSARLAANKDAYIAYMQGLKNMPQMSAVSSNGGYAQSLLNKQQLNYENNRGNIEQNYLDNLRQLQTNRGNGIVSANQDYMSDMVSLIKSGILKSTAGGTTNSAAAPTAGEYMYKLGGKSYSEQEFVNYLKGMGMSQEEIVRYMQARGLSL